MNYTFTRNMTINYSPLRNLLLVKKFEDKTTSSGIYLPDNAGSKFIKLEVLAVGPDVKEDISRGDIIFSENMFETIDNKDKNIGLLVSHYAMCIERVENGRK